MSMFRTLQHQPRVISLFSNNLEHNRTAASILQLLKGNANDRLNVQLDNKFPTLDQLKYMKEIDPSILTNQIPKLNEVMKRGSHDSIFHSDLQDCVAKGLWNSKTPLWVDWEKRRMGNDSKSIEKLLKEMNLESQ